MTLAPIVLFIYKRPELLQKTLESLARNTFAQDSTLIVYADGFKTNATIEEEQQILEAREVVRSKQWCKEVILIEREENLGLAKSIIAGVTETVNQYGKVIVLEDDLELSPYFLRYMNEALDIYQNESKVLSIGACNFYDLDIQVDESFFLPIPDCWGWATWADRWALFETDSKKLYNLLAERGLLESFDLHGAYYFSDMLKMQAEGKISSWAIRWQAVAYIHNKLTLYPKYSMSIHVGIDKDATHGGIANSYPSTPFLPRPINLKKHNIYLNKYILRKIIDNYAQLSGQKIFLPWTMLNFKEMIERVYRKIKDTIREPQALPSKTEEVQTNILWTGNYASWEEAKQACTGYEAANILETVRQSVLKVKRGEAVYERDSVLFDEIQYSWPLLAILLRIATEHGNQLSVLDFGGSLGSSYFQNRGFLAGLESLEWSIVEQQAFVSCGKAEIEDHALKFYYTVEECMAQRKPHVLLLSGVLQCLDAPYQWLENFKKYGIENIVFDRTAFINRPEDRLTIQHVPDLIYAASYPTWFLDYHKLVGALADKYDCIATFDNGFTPPYTLKDGATGRWNGIFFKLRKQ